MSKYDSFISYSNSDAKTAHMLLKLLEARGIKCWIAPRDIRPGRDYGTEINIGIQESNALLLVFSKSTNLSKHCLREVELALKNELIIVPIRIEDTLPEGGLEYRLSTVQWIDWFERSIDDRILDDIQKLLDIAKNCDRRSNNVKFGPNKLINLKKLYLFIAGVGALAIAIIVSIDMANNNLAPKTEYPKARFTTLEDTKSNISEKIWKDPLKITYEMTKIQDKLILKPKGLALDNYYYDNVIHSLSLRQPYFIVEFPEVNFLVSNPLDHEIEIQELRIEVDKSLPDLRPLFLASPICIEGQLKVHLKNEGWGPAADAKISLSLHYHNDSSSFLTIQRSYNTIRYGVLMNISEEAENFFDCNKTTVWISGTVKYSFFSNNDVNSGSYTIKATQVHIPRIGGGPSPITGEYDFVLEPDNHQYIIRKIVSHRIKPGKSDHLLLRFAAPVSSQHQFRIFADLSDGRTIKSKLIDASIFLPRANAIRLQEGSNTIGSVSDKYFIDEPPTGLTN